MEQDIDLVALMATVSNVEEDGGDLMLLALIELIY
jgi:hypothetical protein